MNSGFDHLHFSENWHSKSDERRKQNLKEIKMMIKSWGRWKEWWGWGDDVRVGWQKHGKKAWTKDRQNWKEGVHPSAPTVPSIWLHTHTHKIGVSSVLLCTAVTHSCIFIGLFQTILSGLRRKILFLRNSYKYRGRWRICKADVCKV